MKTVKRRVASMPMKFRPTKTTYHYLNYARTEQRLFDEVVTCYERERMFEHG